MSGKVVTDLSGPVFTVVSSKPFINKLSWPVPGLKFIINTRPVVEIPCASGGIVVGMDNASISFCAT